MQYEEDVFREAIFERLLSYCVEELLAIRTDKMIFIPKENNK